MQQAPTLFNRAAAILLAQQNTADDGEWTYTAEPKEGSPADLYTVAIFDQDGHPLGHL